MSTGCEFHADAMADLATGRLEPAREARVREHLAACASCSDDFEVLSLVARSRAAPPEGLEARIRAAVRGAAAGSPRPTLAMPPRRGWRPWALPLAAAAGLALIWIGVPERTPPAADPVAPEAVVVGSAVEEPYGAWPADGPEVAGEPVLSELSDGDLELLLEEMQP